MRVAGCESTCTSPGGLGQVPGGTSQLACSEFQHCDSVRVAGCSSSRMECSDIGLLIVSWLEKLAGPQVLLSVRCTHRSWRDVLSWLLDENHLCPRIPAVHQLGCVPPDSGQALEGDLLRRIGWAVCDNRRNQSLRKFSLGGEELQFTAERADASGKILANGFVVGKENHVLRVFAGPGDPPTDSDSEIDYCDLVQGMRALFKHVLFQLHRFRIWFKIRLLPLLAGNQQVTVQMVAQLLRFLYQNLDRQSPPGGRYALNAGILNLLDAYSTLRVGFSFEATSLADVSWSPSKILNDVCKDFGLSDPWGDFVEDIFSALDKRFVGVYGMENFARLSALFHTDSPGGTIVVVGGFGERRMTFSFPKRLAPFPLQTKCGVRSSDNVCPTGIHGHLEGLICCREQKITVGETPTWHRGNTTLIARAVPGGLPDQVQVHVLTF